MNSKQIKKLRQIARKHDDETFRGVSMALVRMPFKKRLFFAWRILRGKGFV